MTVAATYASHKVPPSPSYYRAEQYDSDLGLYYLRARYYNPVTGRFMSRDPEDGKATDPKSLHKYLYADGDPANASDPRGYAALFSYVNTLEFNLRSVIIRATLIRAWVTTGVCLIANIMSEIAEDTKHEDPVPIEYRLGCLGLSIFSWAQLGLAVATSAANPLTF